jgi:hypothetical protein
MRAMSPSRLSLVTAVLLGCSGAAVSPDAALTDVAAPTDAAAPADAATADLPTAPADAGCVPDRAQWDGEVRALVQRQCGTCHGAAPSFGAPFSLLDYDALLQREGAARRVDLVARALAMGTMPPSNTPAPPAADAERITAWASCGAQTASTTARLRVSRPWMRAPVAAPTGLASWELRTAGYPVAQNLRDRYQCFTFNVPPGEERFIRRFEMIADRAEVLHHVVLLRDTELRAPTEPFECFNMPEGSQYLYAWAPGQDSFEFPSGGLRMRPGERYVLQMHYNNGQGLENVRDNSGVRLLHGPAQGTEYGMLAIGPVGFQIPARATGSAASACTFQQPTRLFAGGPHMHVIGSAFSQRILRTGGAMEPLIDLENWDFNLQFTYDLGGTLLQPGDRIETRCTWNNPNARAVTSGPGTNDEMCFNFAYVTPPAPTRYCDQPLRMPGEVTYTPGRCAPPAANTNVPTVSGRMRVDEASATTGGEIPSGRWELAALAWHVGTTTTPIGTIDVNASAVLGRGQVWTSQGRLIADLANRAEIAFTGGARFNQDVPVSVAGAIEGTGATRTLRRDCGGMGDARVHVSVTGDELVLGFDATNFGGVSITPRYTFRRMP